MEKILIAGGSGFIGQRLTELIQAEKNAEVAWLSRNPNRKAPVKVFQWNPAEGSIDPKALEGVTCIINLAGAGIADKRWSASRKKLLIDSRVQSAKTLEEAVLKHRPPLKCYLGASAIGYYGDRGEVVVDETANPGKGFLTESTQKWEAAHHAFSERTGVRTVLFRIGIVLEKGGGALKEIERPVYFGAAAYFGDGKAWYAWIHRDDVCRMFLWALKDSTIEGTFNGVAPYAVRNKEMVYAIKDALDRFAIPAPAPAFVMRIFMGEMADVVLNSTHVSAAKVMAAGFSFEYPKIEKALADIYS